MPQDPSGTQEHQLTETSRSWNGGYGSGRQCVALVHCADATRSQKLAYTPSDATANPKISFFLSEVDPGRWTQNLSAIQKTAEWIIKMCQNDLSDWAGLWNRDYHWPGLHYARSEVGMGLSKIRLRPRNFTINCGLCQFWLFSSQHNTFNKEWVPFILNSQHAPPVRPFCLKSLVSYLTNCEYARQCNTIINFKNLCTYVKKLKKIGKYQESANTSNYCQSVKCSASYMTWKNNIKYTIKCYTKLTCKSEVHESKHITEWFVFLLGSRRVHHLQRRGRVTDVGVTATVTVSIINVVIRYNEVTHWSTPVRFRSWNRSRWRFWLL